MGLGLKELCEGRTHARARPRLVNHPHYGCQGMGPRAPGLSSGVVGVALGWGHHCSTLEGLQSEGVAEHVLHHFGKPRVGCTQGLVHHHQPPKLHLHGNHQLRHGDVVASQVGRVLGFQVLLGHFQQVLKLGPACRKLLLIERACAEAHDVVQAELSGPIKAICPVHPHVDHCSGDILSRGWLWVDACWLRRVRGNKAAYGVGLKDGSARRDQQRELAIGVHLQVPRCFVRNAHRERRLLDFHVGKGGHELCLESSWPYAIQGIGCHGSTLPLVTAPLSTQPSERVAVPT
mmetsp:Transcript_309/g.719  ORF Transcript_309/g.719 Transcript_309/m.719 type:complete len:290 (-) Transcript_309:55-924(-)